MPERYKIHSKEPLETIEGLSYVLRLMMSSEAIKSLMRWERHLGNTDSTISIADKFVAMFTALGLIGETIRVLKEGKKGGYIGEEMVAGNGDLLKVWNECTSTNPRGVVQKAHRARDKYFAHWDECVARSFLKRMDCGGKDSVPFIEEHEDRTELNTRYPWAQAAFAFDLADNIDDKPAVQKLLSEIGELKVGMVRLLAELITRTMEQIFERGDLCFVPLQSS